MRPPTGPLAIVLALWHIIFAIVRPQKRPDIKLSQRPRKTIKVSKKHINSAKVNSHAFTCGCNHVSTISTIDNTNSLTKGSFPLKTWAHKEQQTKDSDSVSRGEAASQKNTKCGGEKQNSNKKMTQTKIISFLFLVTNFYSSSSAAFVLSQFPVKMGLTLSLGKVLGQWLQKKSLRTHEYRVKHTSIYCFLFCFSILVGDLGSCYKID